MPGTRRGGSRLEAPAVASSTHAGQGVQVTLSNSILVNSACSNLIDGGGNIDTDAGCGFGGLDVLARPSDHLKDGSVHTARFQFSR